MLIRLLREAITKIFIQTGMEVAVNVGSDHMHEELDSMTKIPALMTLLLDIIKSTLRTNLCGQGHNKILTSAPYFHTSK